VNFRTGQKIICVDAAARPFRSWGQTESLSEGRVYTVRAAFMRKGTPTLWLDEVERDARARVQWGDDVGYGAWRFRPVVERKTDISIFTKMLKTREHAIND